MRPWPSVLNWHTTEIMIVDFHKAGHVSQKTSRLFLNMARHPLFDHKDIRSETIVHQLLKCRLTVSCRMILGMRGNSSYRLWKRLCITKILNHMLEPFRLAKPPDRHPATLKHLVKPYPCCLASLSPHITVSLQRGKAARSTLQGGPLTALATTASHSAPSSWRPCQAFS